jgi:hypothetical protein
LELGKNLKLRNREWELKTGRQASGRLRDGESR